jgi:methylated-DNA-[protein]-cysteine S-methyltransferase
VGAANGANPLPIVVPCHRVIGSNGSLTGFGGGLPLKQALLALERGTRDGQGAMFAGRAVKA